ncbi:SusC/RagA family TonB-linked outer membrane protein [Pricia sp.]|uniref:SusC/RagA family TonB-linked outer membrane protein n=1 Tax=Pricia sp. TaxID=2268138 RepID=UPI0035934C37
MRARHKGLLTLLLALVVQISFAQEKSVTGTVTDQNDLPLPGVNILVQGTTDGTQTDFDGNYSIEASEGDVLLFTYIGQADKSETVGAGDTVDVQMVEDAQALDEVVVTALGISREKKSLGYSTQAVDGDELTEARNTNAINALSGKVAGISISNSSGNLGGSSRILLRGAGSVTQDNRPLFVVDGVPLDNSNFNSTGQQQGTAGRDYGDASQDINPDDIASMNVLKGGPAAALYGSRAQNGVIIITTKSGKAGKPQITFNSGVSFDKINVFPQIQKLYGGGAGNPDTIGQSDFNQATINGTTYDIVDYATDESWGPRYDPSRLVLHWDAFDPEFPQDFLNPRPWIFPKNPSETFYNTGISYNNGVSFSTGTEKSSIRLSMNNTQTQGIIPNSSLNKTNLNFNGSAEINDRLTIDAGVNFTVTDGFNRPETGYTGFIQQFYQFGQTSLDMERLQNYRLPDGTQRTWNRTAFDNPTPRFSDNPYWIINQNTAEDKRVRWYGNLGLKYDVTDNLFASIKIYADTYNLRISEQIAVGGQAQSEYQENDRNFQEINYEASLNYNKLFFDDKLSFDALVGMNRRDAETHRTGGETEGGLAAPGIYNINNTNGPATFFDFDTDRRINSVFGSASFGYDNFLYLTVTGRNDWSSTLPAENNSYFYPSVNGSIVFSNLIDAPWLSLGKLRGGWAQVGNDTEPYRLINTFGSRPTFLSTPRFNQPDDNLNPDLRPEQKDTWEVGLEMAFFKNRLSFDITYYDELTNDLITPVSLDPGTGYEATVTNAGKLSNKGIEALVNITPIRTEDFSWDFTWNFSKNKNELLELLPGVEALEIGRFPFNGVTLNAVVGEPYGVIRGTNYVFDAEGNRVVDANGRYAETRNVENLGSVLPDYNMGIRNSIKFKNLDFSFLIDMQKGGKYRSLTNAWGHYSGILEETAANNIREDGLVLEGVTGTITYDDQGDYTVTDTAPNTQVISAQTWGTDFFLRSDAQNVFDADYVKLREITLGYTLPGEWFKDALESVRISAYGRNLFVWGLDNEYFDPEVTANGSGNIQGSEGGSLPSTRTYGFNLQIKF